MEKNGKKDSIKKKLKKLKKNISPYPKK